MWDSECNIILGNYNLQVYAGELRCGMCRKMSSQVFKWKWEEYNDLQLLHLGTASE